MSALDHNAIDLALRHLREQPDTARRLNKVAPDLILWFSVCEDLFPVHSYGRASSIVAAALEIMEAHGELANPTDHA